MNTLTKRQPQFEFLNTVYPEPSRLATYIGSLYEDSLLHGDGEVLIPSQFQFIDMGWGGFESEYFDHIIRGYGGEYGADVRFRLESGEYGAEDIMQEFIDMKDNLASFGMFFANEKEDRKFIRDLSLALSCFNLSYYDDDSEQDFFRGEDMLPKKWVNPAISEVW